MKRIDTRYAYALGFAKAAEACGVDPEGLVKTAQTLKTLARPFTRYWELLAGTGKATNGYRAIRGQLDGVLNMAARNNDADAVKKLLQLKSQLDIAAHNHTQALGRPFWRQVSKYGIKPKGKVYGEGLVKAKGGGYKFNKDVSGELDKVLAARLGTAGVGLGGGYLALAGGNEEV